MKCELCDSTEIHWEALDKDQKPIGWCNACVKDYGDSQWPKLRRQLIRESQERQKIIDLAVF